MQLEIELMTLPLLLQDQLVKPLRLNHLKLDPLPLFLVLLLGKMCD